MATQLPSGELNLQEQIARIRKTQEEVDKFAAQTRKAVADMLRSQAETRVLPMAVVFQGAIAFAAILGAGAALAKLFFP